MADAGRAVIPPIAAVSGPRPRWSVVIPTYECAEYLRVCLDSVVSQALDPSAMEIVVLDDSSTDRPEDVVDEVGHGRVVFVRHDRKLGAIGNFNACLERSRGELVHLLHGDDAIAPGFYAAAGARFDADPALGMFVSRATYVDEHGHPEETTRSERDGSGPWLDVLDTLAVSNRIRPPGVVVRRALYEQVGGFRTDLPHAADWEMWVRLAAAGPVWFEDRSLASYRRHGASDTAGRVVSGDNVRERFRCIEINLGHLQPERRRRQARRAYGYSGIFAARTAARLARRRNAAGAVAQLVQAADALRRAVLA